MLVSILITGGAFKDRLHAAQKHASSKLEPEPDVLILEADPSISIANIRTLEKFLSQKPYHQSQKIAFLPQANKLTLPAQNALLKTLEEPPANSLIILLAPHDNLLLPTIVSRCYQLTLTQTNKLTPTQLKTHHQLFQTISQTTLGQRINLASQQAPSKATALEFCHHQLLFLRQQMFKNPSSSPSQLLRQLIKTIHQLEANLNPKLCLESLFFAYPKA